MTDRATGKPVAGAPVRRLQGGSELAFTDERGLAPVALREPEQLAVVVDGYLLRLVPTHLGTSEREPQEVVLVRDEWSIVRKLHLLDARGAAVPEAFLRFRPQASTRTTPSPVPASDAVAARAWNEHTMLATRPAGADVPVQLGSYAEDRVHRLADGAEVRFVAAAEYTIEAATTSGLAARCAVNIAATPRAGAPAIEVRLQTGAFVTGAVVDAGDAHALADCKLTLQGGDPLGLEATTASDGRFRFGPIAAGAVTLLVRPREHEAIAFGPLQAPAADVRIAVQALPKITLRGRVRSRPSLTPLAGATVSCTTNGAPAATAVTDAEGVFTLRASVTGDVRLAVQAAGHLAYAEMVAAGAPFADYDLWSSETNVRLASGTTAVLEGIVVDAEGRPVADATVRWQPQQRAAGSGLPGRRVVEGGSLDLPLATRSGPDGAFRLETTAFGAGRIALAEDPRAGFDVVAIAGQSKSGLRLQH